MIIALAQIASVDGDVTANVERHVRAVRAAVQAGADVVLFPELSLTGYVPERVSCEPGLLLQPDDPRLGPLREECSYHGVTAIVGAPSGSDRVRHLSALILHPGGGISRYAKRNLFGFEQEVFVAGDGDTVIEVTGKRLAVGICFDLGDDQQADGSRGTDAWLLSVLLSPEGYGADADRAAHVARTRGLPVVLANHTAATGNWTGAGGSGVWWPDGRHVVADAEPGVWSIDLEDPASTRKVPVTEDGHGHL